MNFFKTIFFVALFFSISLLAEPNRIGKVLFFNIDAIDNGGKWFDQSHFVYPDFKTRFNLVIEEISQISPDIVAFTEASIVSSDTDFVISKMRSIGYSSASDVPSNMSKIADFSVKTIGMLIPPLKPLKRNSGLIIFTKATHKVDQCYHYIYKNRAYRDAFVEKGVLACDILLNNDIKSSITIGVTHLQAGDYKSELEVRRDQVWELYSFITDLMDQKNRKFIFGGDFNIDFRSDEYPLLFKVSSTSGFYNLHLTNLQDGQNFPNYSTYNNWNVILDHIFVNDNDLKNYSLEVKEPSSNTLPSDHKMLMATFSY